MPDLRRRTCHNPSCDIVFQPRYEKNIYCSKDCYFKGKRSKPEDHEDCSTCMYMDNKCVLCIYKDQEEDYEDNKHMALNRGQAIKRGKRRLAKRGAINGSVGTITEKGKDTQKKSLIALNKIFIKQRQEIIEDKRKAHPKGWNTKEGTRV